MFELNNLNVVVEEFNDSKIYTVDNCLKYPEKVIEYLNNTETPLWKIEQPKTLNGIFFDDRRHIIKEGTSEFRKTIKDICGAKQDISEEVYSNYTIFYDDPFNDYKSHFWYPHLDEGYTALLYLNNYQGAGTNLYEQIESDYDDISEHSKPWRDRYKYGVIKTLESKFNRLVIFDGKKFKHGMAIEDETFFHQRRMNLAIFYC
jgi:hypothetical protein